MPLYEHVFLARQDLAQAQVDALAENATKIVEAQEGKVTKVEEGFVEVELAPNVKVRAVKSTLTDLIDPAAKPAND